MARILAKGTGGAPLPQRLQKNPSNTSKKSIRRLHKVDPTVGRSMPEANTMTTTRIILGNKGGYFGFRKVRKSLDPQPSYQNITTIKPPRKQRLIHR
jgi:hypothetical protein